MLQKITSQTVILSSPEKVVNLFREVFAMSGEEDKHKEKMYVLGINSTNTLLYIDLVSIGTINKAAIYPREVVRQAIIKNASAIIICHNHPGGGLTPSVDDVNITKKIKEICKIIDVLLLDHIILSNTGYFSMKTENYLLD